MSEVQCFKCKQFGHRAADCKEMGERALPEKSANSAQAQTPLTPKDLGLGEPTNEVDRKIQTYMAQSFDTIREAKRKFGLE